MNQMLKSMKEILSSVPTTNRDEKIVTLEPRDPTQPPPALSRTWTEIMLHKQEIADLQAERERHIARWNEASELHQRLLTEIDRKCSETQSAYADALHRWDIMTAPLGEPDETTDGRDEQ